MSFYTYILSCSDGSFYVGQTKNITRRLRQHNGEIKGGAKYTSAKRPVILTYFEQFETHKDAAQREYALKQLNHKEKKQVITSQNKNTCLPLSSCISLK